MKSKFFIVAMCVSLMAVLTGCGGTMIYEPGGPGADGGVRDPKHISAEEWRKVAQSAIQEVKSNPRFIEYLKEFKKKYPERKRPIMKLDETANRTSDPDLDTTTLTGYLQTELINSGLVDVTMVEGKEVRSAAGDGSRNLEFDDNFDQTTVAKRGTLKAANLVLTPVIREDVARDGRKKDVSRTFIINLVDVDSGTVIWKYAKTLAFLKTRPYIGW